MFVLQVLMTLSLFAAHEAPSGAWSIQNPQQDKILIDLPVFKAALTRESDLNEQWKLFLIQDLLQRRMALFCTSYLTKDELHTYLQGQIEKICIEGFSKEEFTAAQTYWAERLLSLEVPSNDLNASLAILHSLEHEDLCPYIQQYVHTSAHSVTARSTGASGMPLRCASPLSDSAIMQTQHTEKPQIESEIVDAFYELSLPDHERKLIHELIRNMAEKSIWGLLFKKREMERLGKRVNHVHPMRFIGYILADPRLKRYLKEVSTSSFKWDHFIDGFSKRMKEESARDNVMPYIPGMAHSLKFDPVRMTEFINDKDYEGLVKAILSQR